MKWIATLFATAACLSAADLTPAQWREDIDYLSRELPARHKNLFFHLSKPDFEKQVDRLRDASATASDIELRAGLMRLIASVGDLHTTIDAFDSSRNFGMGFYEYPDGVFISSARVQMAEAFAAKVVAVQGVPVAQVMEKLRQFVPHENDMVTLALAGSMLGRPGALLAAGVPVKDSAVDFEMERGGKRFTLHATLPTGGPNDTRRAPLDGSYPTPLYQSDRVSKYWLRFLPDTQTLFIQYNACTEDPKKPMKQFAEEVTAAIGQQKPKRIVVDLRHNGGGDSRVVDPLVAALKAARGGKLFTIIGRNTFSSGFMAAHDLKQKAGATLVGEPTGQKPNSYGEVQSFNLPNSKIRVSYSTKYFHLADKGDPPSLMPDHRVPMTSETLQTGRDAIMEWIVRN